MELEKPGRHHLNNLTSPEMGHIEVMCPLIGCNEKNIISLLVLPKIHNLNVIMKNFQTSPN